MGPFRIKVGKEELGFAAAHFIAFAGGGCERLHGHNYRVAVTLAGELNEAGYLFDFVELRATMERLLAELDHRLLLPGEGERLVVERLEDRVEVRCEDREYRFPAADVRILPIDNTTAERLAEHLAARIAEQLSRRGGGIELEVEVEESPGRSATHSCRIDG